MLTQWRTCSVTILDNEPPSVLALFEVRRHVEVAEGSGTAQLNRSACGSDPERGHRPYRSFAKSATPDLDYVAIDGELPIPAGPVEDIFEIEIIEDGLTEDAEAFRVELYDPYDLDLGYPPFTDVTILDNEPEPETVTYSVGVDSSNWIYSPLGIDIVDGTATFLNRGLPDSVAATASRSKGWAASISVNAQRHRVRSLRQAGGTPADVIGGLAISATRAFLSFRMR